MYHEDWFIRQIQFMIQAIMKMVFKKDTVGYIIADKLNHTDTDLVYRQIYELLDKYKINEAENLLFENINPENMDYLLLALDFYNRINQFSDDILDDNNFSREEIISGLEEVKVMYGIGF